MFGAVVTLAATLAIAQPVRVMPVAAPVINKGGPSGMVLADGVLYFSFPSGGRTLLWKSDGTAEGTVPVKDVSTDLWSGYYAVSGNQLFFKGSGAAGSGLWVTGGTLATTQFLWSGTVQQVLNVNGIVFFTDGGTLYRTNGAPGGVVALRQFAQFAGPRVLMEMGGALYFTTSEGTNFAGLWRSDGTPAGTVLVKSFPSWNIGAGVEFQGKLYFGASDGVTGYELWVSDGTAAGTTLLKDINPGPVDGSPFNFSPIGAHLYFLADDGVTGREVWRTDGTAAGTQRVKDVNPGPGSSLARDFLPLGGQVLFTAKTDAIGWQLWRTDGTDAGTAMVKQIGSDQTYFPQNMTLANGSMCFTTRSGHEGTLWRTDGTGAGTIQIMADVVQGSLWGSFNLKLPSTGTRVYFAKASSVGVQIWSTDCMTPAGNVMVVELPLPSSGYPYNLNSLTSMGNHLILSAATADLGQELWRAEATGGTLVKDVEPGAGSGVPSPIEYVLGTPGGDYPVPGASLRDGQAFWFRGATGAEGIELWRSDGTPGGTTLVKDIRLGPVGSSPRFLTKVGANVFFVADDGVHGKELWKSDGTDAGTVLVKDIRSGMVNSFVDIDGQLFEINGTVFFRADDGVSGVELWKSDGTDAGTVLVKDINPGAASGWPSAFANLGGTLVFGASTPEAGFELWKSDGTAAGTVMVKDIFPGPQAGISGPMVVMGGFAYFAGNDDNNGFKLWKSDGTAAGTTNVFTHHQAGQVERMAVVNGAIYLMVTRYPSAIDLWKSDGTAAGTTRLRTFAYASSAVDKGTFVSLAGVVYFLAEEAGSGLSLWRTDGTPTGTYRIDLFPGFKASNPVELTVVGDRLYFIANDGVNPRSLYDYIPRPPAEEITRLGNISSRARVQTGDDVMIGGFIVGGQLPKTVVVRARGPSLTQFDVSEPLANPQMQLFSGATPIAANDDWGSAANATDVQASGFAPANPQESAILATLPPGAYTAIVSGVGGTTGTGIVEVFELGEPAVPLLNISTRGNVQTGESVLIGGFVIQGSDPQKVMVRARGPSMQQVPGTLANPQLQLFSGGTQIAFNDNWLDAQNAVEIDSSGKAPGDPAESAILVTLQPGAYTAIVSGVGGTSGIAIVEVFKVD